MQDFIHYSNCPVCNSIEIGQHLLAKDATVSGAYFSIWHCKQCSFRFTQDIPVMDAIGAFYQSDDYVSHSDTKKGLIHKLYHLVRNHTLQTKCALVVAETGKSVGKMLDVGAGTGAFSKTMKDAGWDVTGLEPDDTARKLAFEKNGLTLQNPNDLYNMPSNQFDAICLWHVLEHVHDLKGYIENFHRILNQHGKLLIAVPNYTSDDAATYGAFWAAYDVPRHLYHFSPDSMKTLANKYGFELKAMKPMWFDSFYVSMLSEKCKTGKTHMIPAIWNGLVSNLKALMNKERCSSIIYILSKRA